VRSSQTIAIGPVGQERAASIKKQPLALQSTA